MNKAYLYIGIAVFGTFLSCKQAEVVSTQKTTTVENKNPKIKTEASSVEHNAKPETFETESESPRPTKTNTPKK